MYVKRTIEASILDTAKSFPCIVVYGPRQVGKSTTIKMLFGKDFKYITLDDIEDRSLAKSNPKLLLETYGYPLIIDEIQKAPELLDEIKKVIDKKKEEWLQTNDKRSLLYVLTGSNKYELQQSITESLAGRCGVIEMSSFSLAEKWGGVGELFSPDINTLLKQEQNIKTKYKTRHQIFDEIFMGGMPDICTGVSNREIYYKSYVNTYIEKDVRKLISASSEMQFRNFMSILAYRTANELHYDEIASNVGIDVRTSKKWISILETSGIIYLLQPYLSNISNRLIKAPKIYFMDTGLCAFLCKWPNSEILENCAMSGAFYETFVVSELIKNLSNHNEDPRTKLFYYRDIDKKEIDIIYSEADMIYPIEIKKSINPTKATKNFNVLDKYHMPIGKGLVIDSCEKIRPINENAYYVPVYLLGK